MNTTASIGTTVNGSATSSAAPTALYRPNFSQAFQRAAATGPYPNPLFPTPQFSSGGMISNGKCLPFSKRKGIQVFSKRLTNSSHVSATNADHSIKT